jgi:hypothetical protein
MYPLFYGTRNRLLRQAEELVDQYHSTDDIDEKFIKFDNVLQIIKNINEIKFNIISRTTNNLSRRKNKPPQKN